MEKISRIVRGNSRVASTDLKSAAAARPGMPNFGRPVGESTSANASPTTTAQRAVALHNDIIEKRKTGGDHERVAQQMADSFFMNRITRPPDEPTPGEVQAGPVSVPDGVQMPSAPSTDQLVTARSSSDDEVEQPPGYKPRGSFVDVRV